MVAGFPKVLQQIFGRLYFPNDFQPIWMIEGLADYERFEEEFGGQYPSYDMIVRMAVLENALPTLDRISTSGGDVLRQHRYNASIAYGPNSGRFSYALDYYYEGFYPTFRLKTSDTDGTYGSLLSDGTGTHDYVERRKSYDLSVIVPFLKISDAALPHVRISLAEKLRAHDFAPVARIWRPCSRGKGLDALATGRVVYSFNNARRPGFSISPEGGRKIELGYERADINSRRIGLTASPSPCPLPPGEGWGEGGTAHPDNFETVNKLLGGDFEFDKYTGDW